MNNPLFSFVNNQNLLNQFMQFKNTFQGDPRQQVQNLLNSGRVTQQQYDQAVQTAKALQKMLGM